MRVALIVLSFNHVRDTIECLRSIYHAKPAMADVIVVDNASTGNTLVELRRIFPDTEIVELRENMGWAGGNNVGIRVALERRYDFVCLVNNDLVFCEGGLDAMLDVAEQIGPCLLHPAIYYYSEPEKAQVGPPWQRRPVTGQDNLYALDFAYGACLAIHAEILRAVGLMDERFFLQLEETDFYLRAARAGYKSLCYTNSRVLHKESVSLGGRQSPVKTYYTVRNSLLIAEKHAGNFFDYATYLRQFTWTMRGLAESKTSALSFLRWFCSHDGSAVAARAGIRDYVLRRFGRMSDATMRSLSKGFAQFEVNPPAPNV